jgi:predicted HicB family RNase H-like nuclease
MGATVSVLRNGVGCAARLNTVTEYRDSGTQCEESDKPLSGQFMTRVDPQLHRQITESAGMAGMSLNAWVNEKLEQAVGQVKRKRSKRVVAGG